MASSASSSFSTTTALEQSASETKKLKMTHSQKSKQSNKVSVTNFKTSTNLKTGVQIQEGQTTTRVSALSQTQSLSLELSEECKTSSTKFVENKVTKMFGPADQSKSFKRTLKIFTPVTVSKEAVDPVAHLPWSMGC